MKGSSAEAKEEKFEREDIPYAYQKLSPGDNSSKQQYQLPEDPTPLLTYYTTTVIPALCLPRTADM